MDFTLTITCSRILNVKLDGMSCMQEISCIISNENSVTFMINAVGIWLMDYKNPFFLDCMG